MVALRAWLRFAHGCASRMVALRALGCGGSVLVPDEAGGSAGSPNAAAIDTAGLPSQLVLHCPKVDEISSLPCMVGRSVPSRAGSLNEVGCRDQTGLIAFRMFFPLGELANKLNQPLILPLVPGVDSDPSEVLTTEWHGMALFSRVDVEGRGFVGRMSEARADFSYSVPPVQFSCDVSSAPFWGVAEDF